jgi:pyruvate dehydrogenase E2 component (dihydrolipoamide acetyltransferase)
MATKVMMEALSPTMEEGRLVKWLKSVGDAVKTGDTLAEVETDKAIMELVARGDGVLRARMAEEGATMPVGTVIGVIAGPDEDVTAVTGGGAATAGTATAGTAGPATATAGTATAVTTGAGTATAGTAGTATATAGGAVRSSPLARRMAAERGIDLARVSGSGPGGRVVRRDLETAATATTAGGTAATVGTQATTAVVGSSLPVVAGTPAVVDLPLSQMRKTIARRLSESIGPVPTFYLTAEIDMTAVGALREQMAATGDQYKVSVNDLVIKSVAIALTRHPAVNSHWMGESIRQFGAAHIGMAVATDDGLIVPVIRDAHLKGLGTINAEARDLAKRARERKLAPAEYSGATFSVSNLGMFGIDQFTAIINPPEAAILAVGATETKPVWENGQWVPRQKMRVTLSCDHRVIDGAVGARFLQTLRQLLENPLMMLH